MSNIILCGYKSCGKTTLGKKIAEKTGRHFIDTDDLVLKNCQLDNIEVFREIENGVIAALVDFQNCVIATGGGSVLAPENVVILKKLGKIFYLRVPKAVIKARLLYCGRLPTLLDPSRPEESFEEMYESRKDLYESIADHIVDSEEEFFH
ncbi:MAG TPA: shikimate kinase [Rhabdochlamydiaceae bacterium]|nr:shikimate kinase [Rhabdochlamydiaceae bacterium]